MALRKACSIAFGEKGRESTRDKFILILFYFIFMNKNIFRRH